MVVCLRATRATAGRAPRKGKWRAEAALLVSLSAGRAGDRRSASTAPENALPLDQAGPRGPFERSANGHELQHGTCLTFRFIRGKPIFFPREPHEHRQCRGSGKVLFYCFGQSTVSMEQGQIRAAFRYKSTTVTYLSAVWPWGRRLAAAAATRYTAGPHPATTAH